jgi:AP-3 complex subunit sigma
MIQVFVEVMDKCFSNVCELDLIFNPQKCHMLLDEIVMGGVVVEPSIGEIWRTVDALGKYEKAS